MNVEGEENSLLMRYRLPDVSSSDNHIGLIAQICGELISSQTNSALPYFPK